MGFRPPLDLQEIMDDYEHFRARRVMYPQTVLGKPVEDVSLPGDPPLGGPGGSGPVLFGSGPHRASTTRSVAPRGPQFSWDPNRYYRDLGIAWPYVQAGRRDLREAYLARGGPLSHRLTYCFKQLLDPAVRAEYDALPLGETYLDDIYVQAAIALRAADEASRKSKLGLYVTAEQVLDRWGYKIVPEHEDRETSADVVDTADVDDHDDEWQEEYLGDDWDYAFFLWKTRRWDASVLADWQALLISEIDSRGICRSLVVGQTGDRDHPYLVAQVGDDVVVFLSRHVVPTAELASRAVHALHEEITALEKISVQPQEE